MPQITLLHRHIERWLRRFCKMDEKPKKGSLKGRGREIMRGLSPKASEDPSPEDAPFFESEEALLNWMEVEDTITEESGPPESMKLEAVADEIEALPETSLAGILASPHEAGEDMQAVDLDAAALDEIFDETELEFSTTSLSGEAAAELPTPPIETEDFKLPPQEEAEMDLELPDLDFVEDRLIEDKISFDDSIEAAAAELPTPPV